MVLAKAFYSSIKRRLRTLKSGFICKISNLISKCFLRKPFFARRAFSSRCQDNGLFDEVFLAGIQPPKVLFTKWRLSSCWTALAIRMNCSKLFTLDQEYRMDAIRLICLSSGRWFIAAIWMFQFERFRLPTDVFKFFKMSENSAHRPFIKLLFS